MKFPQDFDKILSKYGEILAKDALQDLTEILANSIQDLEGILGAGHVLPVTGPSSFAAQSRHFEADFPKPFEVLNLTPMQSLSGH